MAYVYTHIRLDNGLVFYVGIGKKANYYRAYEKSKRNKYWGSIATKAGFKVNIIIDNISWADACLKERELIAEYGRIDLGTGILCNYTNGGDGSNGTIVSEETKARITAGKTGKKRPPITEQTRVKLSVARKGVMPKNYTFLRSPAISIKRIAALKGSHSLESKDVKRKKWAGVSNPRAVRIIETTTGMIYHTLNDAWKASGTNTTRSYFSMMIGIRKNKTTFSYL